MTIGSRNRHFVVAIALAAAFPGYGCDGSREPVILPMDEALATQLETHETLSEDSRLVLAGEQEPGRRLKILGQLVRAESGEPLADWTIQLFQADSEGSYDESQPGVESTARIRGSVRTDPGGRFTISTVMPGDYGSTKLNRHIHISVPGADPEAYDFYFRPYVNDGLRSWAENSDQAILVDLRVSPSGMLVGSAVVPAKRVREARLPESPIAVCSVSLLERSVLRPM
jgi:protocatechuate 3,4-dioxygenase beta subunit